MKNGKNVDFSENSLYQGERIGLGLFGVDLICKNVLGRNHRL